MSKSAEQGLVNKGLAEINAKPFTGEATVAIVGLTRSGTSMMSSLLHAMGMFMGDRFDRAVYEDIDIAGFIDKGDFAGLRELASRRNASHPVWGFKRPTAYKVLPKLMPVLRQPRLIVMFRDVLAIAMRNHVSMQMDVIPSLPRYVDEYSVLVKNIATVHDPMLLVSYEKFLQFPEESIEATAAFVGIALTPELREKCMEAVRNGPEVYLQSSRLRYSGHVDRIVQGKLRGWAMVIGQPKTKAKVHLVADGKIIASGVANKLRKDLVEAGVGDGNHGFEFEIDGALAPECKLEVKAGNAEFMLPNSGKTAAVYGM